MTFPPPPHLLAMALCWCVLFIIIRSFEDFFFFEGANSNKGFAERARQTSFLSSLPSATSILILCNISYNFALMVVRTG